MGTTTVYTLHTRLPAHTHAHSGPLLRCRLCSVRQPVCLASRYFSSFLLLSARSPECSHHISLTRETLIVKLQFHPHFYLH